MERVVIALYDSVAGEFGVPASSVNEQTAVREFQVLVQNMPVMVATDNELYLIGSYDTKNGVITSCEHKLLARGVDFLGSSK